MAWRSWDTSTAKSNVEDFWGDVVSHGVLNVELSLAQQRTFSGRLASRDVSNSRFVNFRSGAHRLRRTPKQSRSANDEHYMLGLQCKGICNIAQGREMLSVKPGNIALVHSGYAFDMEFSEQIERRLVLVPRSLVDRRLGSSALKNGDPILLSTASGTGRILKDIVLHLTNESEGWSNIDCEAAVDVVAHLVAAETSGNRGAPRAAPPAKRLSLSDVETATRMRLTEPDLSPAVIAEELGISLRTLYRLFASERRTFSRFVLEQRLDLAKSALNSSLDQRSSLTVLAMDLGFNDAAHFSRSYRARFGEAPRDTRRRSARRP